MLNYQRVFPTKNPQYAVPNATGFASIGHTDAYIFNYIYRTSNPPKSSKIIEHPHYGFKVGSHLEQIPVIAMGPLFDL